MKNRREKSSMQCTIQEICSCSFNFSNKKFDFEDIIVNKGNVFFIIIITYLFVSFYFQYIID
jgi:hypothetical protein